MLSALHNFKMISQNFVEIQACLFDKNQIKKYFRSNREINKKYLIWHQIRNFLIYLGIDHISIRMELGNSTIKIFVR